MNKFDVFMEINIGGLTKKKLLGKLSGAGIQFNKYANTLFDHPQFSPSTETGKVKLIKISLSGLDLSESCSFDEFSSRGPC